LRRDAPKPAKITGFRNTKTPEKNYSTMRFFLFFGKVKVGKNGAKA